MQLFEQLPRTAVVVASDTGRSVVADSDISICRGRSVLPQEVNLLAATIQFISYIAHKQPC